MSASRPCRRLAAAPLALCLLLGACREKPAEPLPEVRLYAAVSGPAVEVIAAAAAQRGLARVVRVDRAAQAELGWFADPSGALSDGALLVEGSAPLQPDVASIWKDGRRRFAPLCARGAVLLLGRAPLPFEPRNLRDLADPRLAGRQALVPLSQGEGPSWLAALSLSYGPRSVERFLRLLAQAAPRLAASDAEVKELVASGAAWVGLVGSEEAAAAAASARSIEVVYPDQQGDGGVVLPTAVALLSPGKDREAATRLLAFLAGSDAEALLAARAPGYLPLRPETPVPPGVHPAGNVRALPVDWDRLAEEKARISPLFKK
ncbi:MAG TPA: substrate-binding domain-containing protein [Anaeromyxobacteraceae bacterium]|jgi:iron(III) transport system substrate-binding protein|nr:substrate-binding domain-containing protein [Anaeromyxobacteraceae bacterium]